MHGGCQNWSSIYLGGMSGAVRMTSCRKVSDGGKGFESTYIRPRFCWAVLHCWDAEGSELWGKNWMFLKAIKSMSRYSHVYIFAGVTETREIS